MHYVKQFSINGVDTRQIACIELQGAPNAATEGVVGVLGIDMNSPTHDVYKCVAVNGSVYTWELLSSGLSIICAKTTGEGGLTKTFSYTDMLIPDKYLIKEGDLILDSEGYIYQITTIGANACETKYSGTHLGGSGSGSGGSPNRIVVNNGKLQLVTDSGNLLSEVDYMLADDETIYRDEATGKICVIGIRTVTGALFKLFIGDTPLYNTLTPAQKENLFAILTDDKTKEKIEGAISKIISGETVVGKAKHANTASGLILSGKRLSALFGVAKFESGGFYQVKPNYQTLIEYLPIGARCFVDITNDTADIPWEESSVCRLMYFVPSDNSGQGNVLYCIRIPCETHTIRLYVRDDGNVSLNIPEDVGEFDIRITPIT